MAGFFNKTTGNQRIDDALIDAVLLSYRVALSGDMVSIAAFVEQVRTAGRTLTLDLSLPSEVTKSPDIIADDLSQLLRPYGVQRVDINLVWSLDQQQEHAEANKQTASSPKSSATESTAEAEAVQLYEPADMEKPNPNAPPREKQKSAQQAPKPQDALKKHPRINQVVLVSSAKGGVGKSTTAVNLALALHNTGMKVGVLDADIYGPSVPALLGVRAQMPEVEDDQFVPIETHGLAMLSIGNLTGDDDTPIVWRGPKATGALLQLFSQTNWPMLDVLIVDMPPGTGDLQLTIAQRIKVAGAVIVTTPQDIACIDAKKGIAMFEKVGIEVLGLVENMSVHICQNCGHESHVFGEGGAELIAEQKGVSVLAQIPLNQEIRQNADQGYPSVLAGDSAALKYAQLAQALKNKLAVVESASDDTRFF